jgi:SDR family mycofactocin-dependent oxidoreductase
MGRLDGKVAFITGAARGQGRSHAIRLAEEGADIIAVDAMAEMETIGYRMADESDREQTVKAVESLDRRILFERADVRELGRLSDVAAAGFAEFGRIDVVCANAGVCSTGPALEMGEDVWSAMIDINLTSVWRTVRAVAPYLVQGGRGGSIVLTSSLAGLVGMPNLAHYTAAKHGLVGLMRALAVELAPAGIRVNTVHPTNVDSDMLHNPVMREVMTGDPNADREATVPVLSAMHALQTPWVEPRDVSNAIVWLASDEARFVTGTTQVIDAGATSPFKIPHPVEAGR